MSRVGVVVACLVSFGLIVSAPLHGRIVTPAQALDAPTEADGWQTAAPSAAGLDGAALLRMTEAIRRGDWGHVHAVLIEHGGRLAYEAYFPGPDQKRGQDIGTVAFTAETLHDVRSVSKTVTSTLVGIALARGEIASVRQRIASLLPDRAQALAGDKARITLEQVLAMSTGLDWDESAPYSDPTNDERRMGASDDPVGFVLGRALVHEPGSTWNYSGGATQVLAAILEHVTGRDLAGYATERLFAPLGISATEWLGDLAGTPSAASGLRLRARDVAKIGSLFLHQGRWNGRQVVPPAWVATALDAHIENPDPGSPPFVLRAAYGYQWWINTFQTALGPQDVMAAVGNGGQRIFVVPALDLVVTLLGGDYNDPRRFWTPEQLLIQQIIPTVQAHSE
ncbi:MAG: serine hydrolase [Vicinamibacterales bacterium]